MIEKLSKIRDRACKIDTDITRHLIEGFISDTAVEEMAVEIDNDLNWIELYLLKIKKELKLLG